RQPDSINRFAAAPLHAARLLVVIISDPFQSNETIIVQSIPVCLPVNKGNAEDYLMNQLQNIDKGTKLCYDEGRKGECFRGGQRPEGSLKRTIFNWFLEYSFPAEEKL
ncbi:MAG: hypothetical protein SO147_01065, partial [Clostridia bacterium]|nr:hypothetical protein [Clostridia bacterium]